MIFIFALILGILFLNYGFFAITAFFSFFYYRHHAASYKILSADAISNASFSKDEDDCKMLHKKYENKWKKVIYRVISNGIKGLNKYTNYMIGRIPSHMIRHLCYKYILCIEMDHNVVIYHNTIFRDGYKCKIGEATVIGDDNIIDSRGGGTNRA